MKDEDEVVISKCQWDDYLAYNLFNINFKGIIFDIKIEPKNIVKLEKLIELKKKQSAIEELEELHMDVYAKAWNKKDVLELITKRIKQLEEGVKNEFEKG
jgi:hypothetical protein